MNKKTLKEIRRINNSIPEELKKGILKKVRVLESANIIYEKLKKNPKESPKTLERLQILKDGGYLDEMEEVENTEVTAKINDYLEEQINRSIKLGRLPKKEDIKKLLNKSQKYVRKSSK